MQATIRTNGRGHEENHVAEGGWNPMSTDPVGNVAAFMTLTQGAQVQSQMSTSVLKKAMDTQSSAALQLIQSLDPNVGKNLDVQG